MTTTTRSLTVDRITAARIPALLGLSPHQDRAGLLRAMVREHFGDKYEFNGADDYHHDHGSKMERNAIGEYEENQRLYFAGENRRTVIHPKYDFLAATPDAITDAAVIAFRIPFRNLYTCITQRPDFEAELQMQMEVTGLPMAKLVMWRGDTPATIETVWHNPSMVGQVLPVAEKFLADYRTVLGDPTKYMPHREPLPGARTDLEWVIGAEEFLELDYLVKRLTAERDAASEYLADLSPTSSARGNGVELLRFDRRGLIAYKTILADLKIKVDLEKYRGGSTPVVTVRRIGSKPDHR